jgi:hypothetical protein
MVLINNHSLTGVNQQSLTHLLLINNHSLTHSKDSFNFQTNLNFILLITLQKTGIIFYEYSESLELRILGNYSCVG